MSLPNLLFHKLCVRMNDDLFHLWPSTKIIFAKLFKLRQSQNLVPHKTFQYWHASLINTFRVPYYMELKRDCILVAMNLTRVLSNGLSWKNVIQIHVKKINEYLINHLSSNGLLLCITSLASKRSNSRLQNIYFGVCLQDTRHNMAGCFCLFSAFPMPSLTTHRK